MVGAKATASCVSSTYVCSGVTFPYSARDMTFMSVDEVETQPILTVVRFQRSWNVSVQLTLQVTGNNTGNDSVLTSVTFTV